MRINATSSFFFVILFLPSKDIIYMCGVNKNIFRMGVMILQTLSHFVRHLTGETST